MATTEFVNAKQVRVQSEDETRAKLRVYSWLEEKNRKLQEKKYEIQKELESNCASMNATKNDIFVYAVCIKYTNYFVPYTNIDKATEFKGSLTKRGIDEADIVIEYSNDFGSVNHINNMESFSESEIECLFNDWKAAKEKKSNKQGMIY